jgi:putative ABC transport system substrate-binding protein
LGDLHLKARHAAPVTIGCRFRREGWLMRRREFIAGFGGAAASSLVARAQQPGGMRRVGVLMGPAASDPVGQARLTAFRKSLQDLGWTEGRNVRFEYRWTSGDFGRVRAYAAELVALAPDVILANSTPVIAALKQATHSIPLVFVIVNDPVAQGFVSSVSHPGENITGFSFMDYSVVGKGMELLKKTASEMTRVGFMFNPDTYPYYEVYLRSFLAAPNPLMLEVMPARVRSDAEIETAIAGLAAKPGGGLVIPPEPFTFVHREPIIRLSMHNRLPTIFGYRDPVVDGALMSYGPDQTDIFRRSAAYVDRILKGENPGDLPVQAPTKFELVINLKTAKALGLTIPETLLATADQVIE